MNRDQNHAEIVKALKECGYSVLDLAMVGSGCPDILIGYKDAQGKPKNILVEIKTESGSLRPCQIDFFHSWQGSVMMTRNANELLSTLEILKSQK